MIMISDERIDMLLQQLDAEARAHYIGDEYGLPTHNEEINQKMRAAVRVFCSDCMHQMVIVDRGLMLTDDQVDQFLVDLDEAVRNHHSEYGEYALPVGDNPSMRIMRSIVRNFFFARLTQQDAHETIVGQAEELIEGEAIDGLLRNLNQIASRYDREVFGLPIYSTRPREEMIAEVRAFIKHITGKTMSKVEDYKPLKSDGDRPIISIMPEGQPIQPRGIVGDNSLVLNTDSMMQAVAYWLNKEVFKTPVIVSQIHFDRASEDYTVEFMPKPAGEG